MRSARYPRSCIRGTKTESTSSIPSAATQSSGIWLEAEVDAVHHGLVELAAWPESRDRGDAGVDGEVPARSASGSAARSTW